MRLKDLMCEEFEAEHQRAKDECDRLNALFKDVCWYNFETQCRAWREPWPVSWLDSRIELHGVRIEMTALDQNVQAQQQEVAAFEAPSIPSIEGVLLTYDRFES
jgi:hypothetical protein